jgi:hypothetical protein
MEIKGKVHCFFEQSGTFKREFIKLGIPAEDYDIQNNFGETDHTDDLFAEIEKAYEGGGKSVGQHRPCQRFCDGILSVHLLLCGKSDGLFVGLLQLSQKVDEGKDRPHSETLRRPRTILSLRSEDVGRGFDARHRLGHGESLERADIPQSELHSGSNHCRYGQNQTRRLLREADCLLVHQLQTD